MIRHVLVYLIPLFLAGCCFLPTCAAAPPSSGTPEQMEFFEKRIRPLLAKHCYRCHSQKAKRVRGALYLDTRAGVRKGGDSGPALVPGNPEKSLLLKAVRYNTDLRMPPKGKLSRGEIANLEKWIKMGAPDPRDGKLVRNKKPATINISEGKKYWAFRPLQNPALPAVKNSSWPISPIDRFILAKLEAKGLRPVEITDRRTLIRRATYDLTGLPPTPEEIDHFLGDKSPKAFANVVERLLASKTYGERWGRHWLDVVRYADTAGDNSDYPIPQMYLYRNWVIDAFNKDMPYDQFVREQLAGDLMVPLSPGGRGARGEGDEETRRNRIIATGYLANSRRHGSYEDKRYPWHLTIEDTIDNFGKAFLGLTMGCARCHDHKFDPLPTEDYYALYGFFSSTRYPWPGIELDRKQHDLVSLPGSRGMAYAVIDGPTKRPKRIGRVGNVHVQLKGDPEHLGKEVPRRFPLVLGGQKLPSNVKGSGRLQLAKWLTSRDNPLFARVMMNRIWQYHFGRGIVATPNNFGKQGRPPTHPKLLDFLARRFIDSGCSIKDMHRLIMLSRTYQLASRDDAANLKIDINNEYLWRFSRYRLDAESIRDTILAVSGNLDRSRGGPHPFPPQKKWNFTQHNPFKAVYDTNRRSVYLMTQRIQRHPFLALFDGPDTNASTAVRVTTTTPLQALFLMNNPLVHENAKKFAARLLTERKNDNDRIDRAFLLAFGRPPTSTERDQARNYLAQVSKTLRKGRVPARRVRARTWESLARALFMSSEFVYVE